MAEKIVNVEPHKNIFWAPTGDLRVALNSIKNSEHLIKINYDVDCVLTFH